MSGPINRRRQQISGKRLKISLTIFVVIVKQKKPAGNPPHLLLLFSILRIFEKSFSKSKIKF